MSPLPPASSARWSRRLGVAALVCPLIPVTAFLAAWATDGEVRGGLACGGLLLAMLGAPLGLAALLLHVRARRQARRQPDRVGPPGPAGAVLGSAALGLWLGTTVAVFFPILIGSGTRAHARDRVALRNLSEGMAALAAAYPADPGLPEDARRRALEAALATTSVNPWNRREPALRPVLRVEGGDPEAVEALARRDAVALGQAVFVLSAPGAPGEARHLAGAVRTKGLYHPSLSGDPSFRDAGAGVYTCRVALPREPLTGPGAPPADPSSAPPASRSAGPGGGSRP